MEKSFEEKLAMSVSKKSIIVNLILFIFKLYSGIVSHSSALISDSIHTASDVFSTFIVMAGIKASSKEADKKHRYGHERIECIAAILLAVSLAIAGFMIGKEGIFKIIQRDYANNSFPKLLPIIAAGTSILLKELMFIFTKKAAAKINSGALLADAYHHHSDGLSSIGSLIGVLGARLGFPILDPIASIVICLFIIKTAIDIFIDSSKKLIDESCDEETENKIKETASLIEGVISIDVLNTRKFGAKIYVDIEIGADKNLSLSDAHKIAEKVHFAVENAFPAIKHCMVHVNPL